MKEEIILYGGDMSGNVLILSSVADIIESKKGKYHRTEIKTQYGKTVFLFDYEGWKVKETEK